MNEQKMLAELIDRHHMSIAAMADVLGVTRNTAAQYASGKRPIPPLRGEKIRKFYDFLTVLKSAPGRVGLYDCDETRRLFTPEDTRPFEQYVLETTARVEYLRSLGLRVTVVTVTADGLLDFLHEHGYENTTEARASYIATLNA